MCALPLPVIQFSHANGLPAPVYGPMLDRLAPYPVQYVERFGHGAFPVGHTWGNLVQELIHDIETRKNGPVIALGHSLGGVLSVQAATKRPDLFHSLILLDPPMFAPWRRYAMGAVRALGLGGKLIPPAAKAKHRRRTFASVAEARAYWSKRPFFQRFDPQCFEAYLQYGLMADGNGGVRLSFDAEIEFRIFMGTPAFLPKAPKGIPMDFLLAESFDTLLPGDQTALKKRYPQAGFHTVAGTHLFPLEQPGVAAERILSLMEGRNP